jgi:hypothetical protein
MTTNPLIRCASLRRVLIIAGALLALGLPVAGSRAASAPFGMRVFTGDNPDFLTFHSAKCVFNKKTFVALAFDRGWRLFIQISPFTGYHAYDLKRGGYKPTNISLESPSGVFYASDFIAPYHIPQGGQISFSQHGNRVGGGFYPMFNADGSDAVGVAGGLTCRYPKGKRRA